MNIGVFTHSRFPADDRIEREIKTLVGEKHKVCVFANKTGSGQDGAEFDIHYYSPTISIILPFIFEIINFPWMIKLYPKIMNFDIVHIHDLSLPLVTIIAKLLGKKVVADVHEGWPEYILQSPRNPLFKFIWYVAFQFTELLIFFISDFYIVVSERARDTLLKKLRFLVNPESKIRVITNVPVLGEILSLEETKGIDLPDSKFLVCYFGTIDHLRGLHILVDSMNELKDYPIHAVIAGDGGYKEELVKMVELNGLDEYFTFTGMIPLALGRDIMRRSDVCLLINKKSKFTDATIPNKIFNYIAFEKPVIATPLKPLTDLFPEELLLMDPYTPGRLTELILEVYKNPEKYREFAKRGKIRIFEEFNWEIESKKLIEVYQNF